MGKIKNFLSFFMTVTNNNFIMFTFFLKHFYKKYIICIRERKNLVHLSFLPYCWWQALVAGENLVRVAYCGENVVADNLNGLKGILSMSFCLRFVCDCRLALLLLKLWACLFVYYITLFENNACHNYWTFVGKGALWSWWWCCI